MLNGQAADTCQPPERQPVVASDDTAANIGANRTLPLSPDRGSEGKTQRLQLKQRKDILFKV